MKAVILQSNYIPWRGYFDMINDADVFVFYDCVQYTRRDWRSRNQIITPNGPLWLTVPIPSEALYGAIDEAVIEDKKWQDTHYKSLMHAYKKAPHYTQLEELINLYLKEHQWTKLSELNQFTIKHIARKIGITTKFVDSRELENLDAPRIERLITIAKQVGATEYLSGLAAKEYLIGNEHMFPENGLSLSYKYYPEYPKYKQLGGGEYNPYVSILDMVANIHWDEMKHYIYEPLS